MDTNMKNDGTILSLFEKIVREDPEKASFIFWDKYHERTVLTRRNLWDKSRKFAAVLRRLGVGKGDIVCNTLVNSPERLITNLGTLVAGAISMHGQMFLADGEDIMKNWKDSKCQYVILDPNQKNGAASILDRLKKVDEKTGTWMYEGLPFLSQVIPVVMRDNCCSEGGTSWLYSFEQEETDNYIDHSVTEDDVAYIFTTSGSTGFAKLVPHTHKSLVSIVDGVGCWGLRPDSVFYNHRSFGWIGGMPVYICKGPTRVALDQTFGMPEDLGGTMVKILNHENVNFTFLLPSDIQLILNALDSGATMAHRLGTTLSGGGPLSTVSMSAIGRFTDELRVVYGSTELGLIYSLCVTDPKLYENSCVGFPVSEEVEMKIRGDNMEELPHGESGELYIRSPTLAAGYLNNIEKSQETFLADGWFRSGDVGHFDSQGQLFVFCRKHNAINHKGFIHYPGWMENRINTHPLIQKSIVVGIPDPVNLEDICLCVIKSTPQTELTSEDVREFCKTLFLTSEKDLITPIPKYYLFFDAFPLNSNAKFDRKVLRAEALKRLGL